MSNSISEQSYDILVIGAGPAGSVAASILHQYGYRVKVVEKQLFPRFVIGESLLPRCMHNLEKAGFINAIEQAGFQKKFGAQFVRQEEICEFDFSMQFTKGWSWTWQVQRASFDKLLADEIQNAGVDVEYEAAVTAVSFNDDGSSVSKVQYADGSVTHIKARFLVDGSGYGRVLPRLLGLNKKSDFPSRGALFCHLRPLKKPEGKERNQIIIIVHTNEVWGWVIPFADGTTSIGIVGDKQQVNQFSGSTEDQIKSWINEIPALKKRFTDCEILTEPQYIQGYSAAVSAFHGKNFVLTGNSSEFVDPIFSSGVTFATESAAKAAELIHQQLSGQDVDWDECYTAYIQRGVNVFKSFIKHWYDGDLQTIFFNKESGDNIREQICSILAGYVWDEHNPFVKKHVRAIPALASVLKR